MSEAHGVAKRRLNPVSMSKFLSLCKKEFKSETEKVSKTQRFH